MGLRVPRSILLIETDSLKRLRNYAKGVMERTVCEDMSRYEQVSEQLLYRVDALISTHASAEIPANVLSKPTFGRAVADQRSRATVSPPRCTQSLSICVRQNFIPRQTFVPRNVKSVEKLVELWRIGDASIGCPIALRNLQSASLRKQFISGYHNSWWVSRNHKDAMARYGLVISSIASMKKEQINKNDQGLDEHWKDALILYHQKWDVSGKLPSMSSLIEMLRKKD
jgi:hypothetical protein